jgi:hypothetical protein
LNGFLVLGRDHVLVDPAVEVARLSSRGTSSCTKLILMYVKVGGIEWATVKIEAGGSRGYNVGLRITKTETRVMERHKYVKG